MRYPLQKLSISLGFTASNNKQLFAEWTHSVYLFLSHSKDIQSSGYWTKNILDVLEQWLSTGGPWPICGL